MGCHRLIQQATLQVVKTRTSVFSFNGKTLESDYRYGFGNFEKDNEVKGNGNHLSFGDYGYSPRLGRRWNIDPVVKHNESPYLAFANNPIWFADVGGLDTLKMHLMEVKSPDDKEYILFKVSFSTIRSRIERVISLDKDIYFGMPRNEYNKKGNKQEIGADVPLEWRTGKFMGETYSKAWNENVIHLKGDLQFMHPVSELSQSVGCFLSCDYPEENKVGEYEDDNGKMQSFMAMSTSSSPGSDVVSKQNLALIRNVYNQAIKSNDDPTFDFFLNVGSVASPTESPIQKIEPRKASNINVKFLTDVQK